jgi:hypothetical protein
MTDSRHEVRPPVTVRELSEGDIVGIARVEYEDDGAGGGRNVLELPGGLAPGRYELEFDDGTRFVVALEPQPGSQDRLDVHDVK